MAPVSATAEPVREEGQELDKTGRGAEGVGVGAQTAGVAAVSAIPLNSGPLQLANPAALNEAPSSNMVIANANKVKQFHPACQAAAQAEVKLSMSTLFHTFYRNVENPSRVWDGNGTCKVQLLRSIGKWSTGTKTECSILNCYLESISSAKHFIYIENQFFVSNTAGEGVSNGIANALVNRILQAHRANEPFQVIVIIPVHPNGDFSSALKAKIVMHYEYATINRGLSSIYAQLRRQAPTMNIANYLGFFSLRNWGVINNKVVSDQIYVHDKLMIVDDRVVIIGSANINDRSMLGHRDSELAIRIEDTLHVPTTMAGGQFMVGYLPHTLRMKLMRQHLDEDEAMGTCLLTLSTPRIHN
jgi:phosphatidylserine/phosphatidylglycerophosphate/cardiolipin synthase-like enzyme